MDWIALKSKAEGLIKKYRYAVLVLLVGLIIMLLPSKGQTGKEETAASTPVQAEESLEERLSSVLSRVSGAGEVRVILTLAAGEETLYQTDDDRSTQTDSTAVKTNTVTVTDSQRNETGLVRQVNPPSYLGAIVVCQGADNASVRLAIMEAVSKATGLGADKISILKMK